MDDAALAQQVTIAREVAERAYAPASRFRVGAVVVGTDGTTYAGCNVENASYGLTICAERSAVSHAIAEGAREFVRCVVFTDTPDATYPCGACRQVLAEFGSEMEIVLANSGGVLQRMSLRDLLPEPFRF